MKKIIIAWLKKKLRIKSPSTMLLGFDYEYDYLKGEKK